MTSPLMDGLSTDDVEGPGAAGLDVGRDEGGPVTALRSLDLMDAILLRHEVQGSPASGDAGLTRELEDRAAMTGWLEELKAFWAADESLLRQEPTSPDVIAMLEARYGVVLPEGFRAYLDAGVPELEGACDRDVTCWWPIERIRNIPEEYQHEVDNPVVVREADRYLFFADYMIWCWAWAINCGEGEHRGKVVVIGLGDEFVADSFEDFVRLYLHDPGMLNIVRDP